MSVLPQIVEYNSSSTQLTKVAPYDRAYAECAQMEGMADAVTLRAVVTSWERFPYKEVQTPSIEKVLTCTL